MSGDPRNDSSPVAPQVAALEDQLRNLTAQIEALRPKHAPRNERARPMRENLDDIIAPLMKAIPLQMIETLERDVEALDDRLGTSRTSGVEPRLLVPIENGLADVRAAMARLMPNERLAAFRSALRDLDEKLNQRRDGRGGSARAQIDAVLAALHDVAGLAASRDALTTLSDEVRGLAAKLQRVASRNSGAAARNHASPQPVEQTLPFSIEGSLKDINSRLEALQGRTQPLGGAAIENGSSRDNSAQQALEATHATLSQLVDQLARNLNTMRASNVGPSGQDHAIDHLGLSRGYAYPPQKAFEFADMRGISSSHSHLQPTAPETLPVAETTADATGRAIVIPLRPLVFGMLVIVLAVVAARVSMQLTELPLPTISKADASHAADSADRHVRYSVSEKPESIEPEVPDLVRTQTPDTAAPVEKPAQKVALAPENENTGTIVRPVPVAAGSRENLREPSIPLPDTMPAALRAEAAKGKASAEYEVGVRLVEGKSAPVNPEEGLRWLRRAAKSGIVPAHLWIGSLYEKGLGVEKDLMLARTHYTAAAEKGNAKAMHNLAVLYAEGIDGRRDYKTAARWFQRAAERGIADSQYNLAILQMRGIGVDQNHQEAYKWFALAALQGDREAARYREEIGSKLEAAALAAAKSAAQKFTPQNQPNDAAIVATPPGGWDRTGGEAAGGRRSQSSVFARGAS